MSQNSSRGLYFYQEIGLYLPSNHLKESEELKKVLHKLWKTNKIFFGRNAKYFEQNCVITDEIIEAIIENCNNLTHIFFGRKVLIGKEVQKKFFDKFGHKLISIDDGRQNTDFTLIKAPNIEELTVCSFEPQLSQIEFNKLKSFTGLVYAINLDSFEVFIENNTKTLKYLDIYFEEKIDDEQSAIKLLEIITKSKNLVHLNIYFEININEQIFINCLNGISINCQQIKSLKLSLEVNESLRLNDELLSILQKFKQLKRLDLHLIYRGLNETIQYHPIEDFLEFNGLTHLTLNIFVAFVELIPNEEILTDIDINLPKLKYLKD